MSSHRPRIAIAGFQHETNTFVPQSTPFSAFQDGGGWPALTQGAAVIEIHRGLNIPLGGFIAAAEAEADLHPILWTNAEPSGLVEDDAFARISGMILDGILAAGTLDGLYLDLHGAMVTESHQDGEGALLRLVRDEVGPDLPIAISLDLHANISRTLFDLSDVITIYRTYPHLDMDETGARAWSALTRMITEGTRPAKAFRQVDRLIPLSAQCTDFGPVRTLYDQVLEPTNRAVLSTDIALGFPLADIFDVGPSVVAYGDTSKKVDAAADHLAQVLQTTAETVKNPLMPPDQAVRRAMSLTADGGTVILADVQDNSGAGARSNSPGLLHAMIRTGAEDAVLAAFWDPHLAASAHQCGVGAEITFEIGADTGHSIEIIAEVIALSDGVFICRGEMQRDVLTDIGPSALLRALDTGVSVIVSSQRHQSIDQQVFRHLGVDPTAQRLVAVKSTVHYRADFAPIAREVIAVEAPGLSYCRLEALQFQNARPSVRP